MVGTVDYMAPEQITGHIPTPGPTSTPSAASSTRCSPARCPTSARTRSRPCSPTCMKLRQPLEGAIVDHIPPSLPVLEKAMAKEPSDRYFSAGDFARDAAAALRGMRVHRRHRRSSATGDATPVETDDDATERVEAIPGECPPGGRAIGDDDPRDDASAAGRRPSRGRRGDRPLALQTPRSALPAHSAVPAAADETALSDQPPPPAPPGGSTPAAAAADETALPARTAPPLPPPVNIPARPPTRPRRPRNRPGWRPPAPVTPPRVPRASQLPRRRRPPPAAVLGSAELRYVAQALPLAGAGRRWW